MTNRESSSRWDESADDVSDDYYLLRAAADAAVEPWALLKAVRDPGGRVVDFVYHDINRLAARQQRLQREDLIGRSVAESLPELVRSGILEKYIHCMETGEPLILDDLTYFGRTLDGPELQTHRYEMRGVRVETDYLSLNWRDINERYLTDEDGRRTREMLRTNADAMLDPQVLLEAVRDSSGKVVDFAYREVNTATCDYLGVEREYLLGRGVVEIMPGIEATLLTDYIRCMDTGEPLVLNDFSYDNEILADTRRYDIRVTRATPNSITLTWRDVTDRFEATQRIMTDQILLSATVDSMLNPQSLLEAVRDRDGQVIDFVYRSVNRAFCSYRGWEERDILGTSLLGAQPYLVGTGLFDRYVDCVETGEEVILDDFPLLNSILGEERRFDIRVVRAGVNLISLTFGDVTNRFVATQRIADSEEKYRLLAMNSTDVIIHGRDGKVAWASPSVADVLGGSPDYWIGRSLKEVVPADQEADFDARQEVLVEGREVQQRTQLVALDGTRHWIHVHSKPFYDLQGRRDGFTASLRLIDDEVADEQALEEARRQQERADEIYRRAMSDASLAMVIATPEGRIREANEAMCQMAGLDAQTLIGMHWTHFPGVPSELAEQQHALDDIAAGTIDSYRMLRTYYDPGGRTIWGDMSITGIRGEGSGLEFFIITVSDVTARVEADERNRVLAQELQSELSSAANYVQSVLPNDLVGQVSASTRYLPSKTLGGDCFDYHWIDDDHLIVYLLDVSGHGVESALIAVSVHNMLRSTSLPTKVLMEPDQVLTTLNKQFAMDQHDFNYFTIFYGVYQASTRTLRYANGGHPPALLRTGGQLTELSSQSPPVGMFDDIAFSSVALSVPLDSELLLYSDGAYEIPLADGGQWSHEEFVDTCARLSGSSGWSLDDLVENLRRQSSSGHFDDDCCLVRLQFDRYSPQR